MFKETREIWMERLRQLCIEKNWFTSGTNEEYDRMLQLVKDKPEYELEKIATLAIEIIQHTAELDKSDLRAVMFEIINNCVITYVIIQ